MIITLGNAPAFFTWGCRARREVRPTTSGLRPEALMPHAPVVEYHLHMARAPGGPGGGYCLPVLFEAVMRADHGLELDLGRYPHRQLEAAGPFPAVLLRAVGVGACEVQLLVPERGEVKAAPGAGHADEGDLAAGLRQAQGVLDRAGGAYAFEDLVGAPEDHGLAEFRLQGLGAEHLREVGVRLFRVDYIVGAEAQGLPALALVLGDADYAAGLRRAAEGGDGEEAYVSGPNHERRVVGPGVRLE